MHSNAGFGMKNKGGRQLSKINFEFPVTLPANDRSVESLVAAVLSDQNIVAYRSETYVLFTGERTEGSFDGFQFICAGWSSRCRVGAVPFQSLAW